MCGCLNINSATPKRRYIVTEQVGLELCVRYAAGYFATRIQQQWQTTLTFFWRFLFLFSAAASFYFLLSYCWRVHVFIVKACMRGIKSFKHSFTILCRLSSGNPSNLSLTTTKSNFAPPSHFPSDKSVTETCDASRSERHCGYVLPRVGRRQRGRR